MRINQFTGETLKISTSVLDASGLAADLTGATAKFGWKKYGEVLVTKDAVISGNKLSVTLQPSETMVAGTYEYEFRIKLNGEEDSVDYGIVILRDRLLKGL